MLSTPPANPALAKPRRAASKSGRPASSVNENARPRASTHWIRSATGVPGWAMLRIASGACLGDEIELPTRLKFVAHQPLRHLAVAGLRQRLPEEEPLRHFVTRHLWQQERRQLRLAHRTSSLARDADGDADLAPERVGHAEHRDLADRGMGQNLLLDLARIDIRSTRNVHVGGSAGDVDKTFRVHMAEIAGAEPAVAERFRVRFGVVVIAGEHAGTDDADLAGFEGLEFAAVVALDRDLHAGALKTAGADPRRGAVLGVVQV